MFYLRKKEGHDSGIRSQGSEQKMHTNLEKGCVQGLNRRLKQNQIVASLIHEF